MARNFRLRNSAVLLAKAFWNFPSTAALIGELAARLHDSQAAIPVLRLR